MATILLHPTRTAGASAAAPLHPVRDFDGLYRGYAPRVSLWARRLVGPDADIEDLVHEVFQVVLRRGEDYDPGRADIGAWLHGITVRCAQAHRRRRRLARAWARLFAAEATLRPAPLAGGSPDKHAQAAELRARLYAWMERLPEAQRTVFILFELDDLEGAEIAAILNISQENVWVRLHRARRRLEELARSEGFASGFLLEDHHESH